MYLIVLLPNYKRTHDQIDMTEKQIRALYRELVLFPRSKKSFRYIPDNESEQEILGWNTSKQIFSIVRKSRAQRCGCTKADALQLKKDWGYMTKNNREKKI